MAWFEDIRTVPGIPASTSGLILEIPLWCCELEENSAVEVSESTAVLWLAQCQKALSGVRGDQVAALLPKSRV